MVAGRGWQHQFTKQFLSLKPIVTSRYTIIDLYFVLTIVCLAGCLLLLT